MSWRALRYGGMGGYERGPVEADETGVLTPNEWERIVATVDSASFWSTPETLTDAEAIRGADGASWLVEGRRDGRYVAVVCQGTEGVTGARVESVGRALLEATGSLPENPQEVY